jgi:hypothetical protein
MLIEHDTAADTKPKWTVAGLDPASRADPRGRRDDQGRYHTVGYTCLDVCEPEGEVRVYAPGGELESQVPMGPLGSAWFGPHDIAWSPAGYAVVALARSRASPPCSRCRRSRQRLRAAVDLHADRQAGASSALAVAVGPFGEVYAGGIGATNHPAFAVIGG